MNLTKLCGKRWTCNPRESQVRKNKYPGSWSGSEFVVLCMVDVLVEGRKYALCWMPSRTLSLCAIFTSCLWKSSLFANRPYATDSCDPFMRLSMITTCMFRLFHICCDDIYVMVNHFKPTSWEQKLAESMIFDTFVSQMKMKWSLGSIVQTVPTASSWMLLNFPLHLRK